MTQIEDRLARGETVGGPEVRKLFGLVQQGKQHIFVYRTVLAFLKRSKITTAIEILEEALEEAT